MASLSEIDRKRRTLPVFVKAIHAALLVRVAPPSDRLRLNGTAFPPPSQSRRPDMPHSLTTEQIAKLDVEREAIAKATGDT